MPKQGRRSVAARVLAQVRPQWAGIGLILLMDVMAIPLALLSPLPLKLAVDSVIEHAPFPTWLRWMLPDSVQTPSTILLFAAGLMIAVVVLGQTQDLVAQVLRAWVSERLTLRFRSRLFGHAQRVSLAFHDRRGSTDSVYRIQYDAPAIKSLVVDGVLPLVRAGLILVAMLVVTARLDVQLALIALAVSPVLLLLAYQYRRRAKRWYREATAREASVLEVVHEVLSSLRVVKAFGREDHERRRFESRSWESARSRMRVVVLDGAYGLAIALTTAAGTAAALVIGVRHVQAGSLTLGELLLVMGYVGQVYAPLKLIGRTAGSLQASVVGVERAFELLDAKPDVPEHPKARPLARAAGRLELWRVSFAHEPNHPVLRDVDLVVPAGSRVGISGPTGAGKTTLLNLLVRFIDPQAGQVLLDGVDLRDYRLADLRGQFAMVLQEPLLFSTTIAENIAYARPGASRAEVVAAARAADAHDFICRLPDGYETRVGERGMRLSGGERQRISLARAFLRDAPILILDEPTSAVDSATEAAIMQAMERLMQGRTTFLVAHRLSTLDGCDLRVEIDAGGGVRLNDGWAGGLAYAELGGWSSARDGDTLDERGELVAPEAPPAA